MNVTEELFKLKDEEYKNFHAKLIPNINPELIIGVRIPVLRKFARAFYKTGECAEFLNMFPHKYYEENNLHAFLIEQITDFETALSETEKFLPYIDNWATCDSFMPRVFRKNKDKLNISQWIKSDSVYTVRFGIGCLMSLYLDEDFDTKYLDMAAEINSDEYYVNMMIAWYFATALAKQYEKTVPYIEEKRLNVKVHNKAIQKARESKRIPKEVKEYLKKFQQK